MSAWTGRNCGKGGQEATEGVAVHPWTSLLPPVRADHSRSRGWLEEEEEGAAAGPQMLPAPPAWSGHSCGEGGLEGAEGEAVTARTQTTPGSITRPQWGRVRGGTRHLHSGSQWP